jgi:hypothetical protein
MAAKSNLNDEQLHAVDTEGTVVLMAVDPEDGVHVATMDFAGAGNYAEGSIGVLDDQEEAASIAGEIALRWNAHAGLVAALERMCDLHTSAMAKTNIGASYFDAETLAKMNEAPLAARAALLAAQGVK